MSPERPTSLRRVPREIALLTNPTAGKGRGAKCAPRSYARLAASRREVQDLQGRDGDEALDLARTAVARRASRRWS